MDELDLLFRAITLQPHEATTILAFADKLQESGYVESAEWIRRNGVFTKRGYGHHSGGGGYRGYGDGGGGGGGDGGFGDGTDGGGGGGGYGEYGDGGGSGHNSGGYGDGGEDDGCGGDDDGNLTTKISEVWIVKNGLYILCLPGGYYPYVVIGWVERYDFLLRVRNVRVIKRFGNEVELSQIAKSGPKLDTVLLSPSDEEWIPLSSPSRIIPCTPSKWNKEVPKPKEEK